ncbi:type VI secretion system tube protein Hcp [Pseudosulfitobacter koreensis]|uniref:Type VI secretion system tube protein Hcp n=1 Tax=Pseudosulfitobacter koreensis TaxID=2968472 RepID=A0ABT1Z2L3_9RHOB|nr:type VI secretion system tube protein Hcp [Pseudosulfitobacter koreense]MCR8827350.1 type VI secretion system tube protein Hcp [Pseudosulfitobacter koreense]
MSFDAFMYMPGEGKLKGETQDDDMSKLDAFEILSFEIGAENNINIGSISSGGGAGKATFKELTVTKKTDTASCGLFTRLCEGGHIQDVHIVLRRSGGTAGKSGATFLKFDFKLVMIQDISWSGSDGDDICEETLVMQYGAMKVEYSQQDVKGTMKKHSDAMWSRVKNKAELTV